jgi:hypothetical protein
MPKRISILTSTALFFAILATTCLARTCTDQSGRQADADFVSFSEGIVKIRRTSDGHVFDVPLERLSATDQRFVQSASENSAKALHEAPTAFVAFNAQEAEKGKFSAAELNASKRVICTWKKGEVNAALKAIEASGLKLEERIEPLRIGICTGKLTDESLKALRSDAAMASVEPDVELQMNQEEKIEPLKEVNQGVLDAYEHAGRMVCVWKKGSKDEAEKVITSIKQFTKVEYSVPLRLAVCEWKPPLEKDTLLTLIASESLQYVEPDTALIANNPTQGRIVEYPQGTPKTVVTNGALLTTPDDPEAGPNRLWGMKSINAYKAWTCANSTNVLVAVIDSGIDLNHPDLKANIATNTGEIPNNGIDDDKNGFIDDFYGMNFTQLPAIPDVVDQLGHGSHVSGTIGAVGNNKVGVAGVNWRVQMLPIKVFGDKPFAPPGSDLARAIGYALTRKSRVINLSLSWNSDREFLKRVIEGSEENGVIIVCAAGNLPRGADPKNRNIDDFPNFPASFPNENVIAVANITETEALNGGSYFGLKSVDLEAPGTDVYSTVPTTIKAEGYDSYTGTSMATPHVAGAVALIWGQKNFSAADYKAVRKAVMDNVRTIPALSGKCVTGGTLDIGFLCKATPPRDGQKPPIVICPPPRCYVPCPPRRHIFFRLRCRGY